MSSNPFPVSAEEAQRQVSSLMRRQRKMRRMPTVDPMVRKLSDDTKVYIFNIGPWAHKCEKGDWGVFQIPACPEGQPYAVMAPVDGLVFGPWPKDEANFELNQWSGRFVAEQIVGIGRNMSPNLDLTGWGVFIGSRHIPEPTEAELRAAKATLVKRCQLLIKEATTAFNKGAKEAEATISDRHRWAAVYMNRSDLKWVEDFEPGQRTACFACGTFVTADVAVCPSCKEVLDQDLLERKRAERDKRRGKR